MSHSVREVILEQFRHFNAGELTGAALGYEDHISRNGRMVVTLAGAMSSAEIGRSLGPLIEKGWVHAICATGANFEEDLFHLFSGDGFIAVEDWRSMNAKDEARLYERGYSRIANIGISYEDAIYRFTRMFFRELKEMRSHGQTSLFPLEVVKAVIEKHAGSFAGREKISWVFQAICKGVPIYIPGWEDSTLGHSFAARIIKGEFESPAIIRTAVDYTLEFARWIREDETRPIGFFQIGGGIAGDFAVCMVPMLRDGCGIKVPHWSYFCQISDSITSYGGYSGAPPAEKITWGKLNEDTRSYMIQSDASIVVPLIFSYLLEGK